MISYLGLTYTPLRLPLLIRLTRSQTYPKHQQSSDRHIKDLTDELSAKGQTQGLFSKGLSRKGPAADKLTKRNKSQAVME
jgi:hypothetical protein